LIKGNGVSEFYHTQLERKKYRYTKTEKDKDGKEEQVVVEKTIKELWDSENKEEKDIARRYSTQIITAMLETILLKTDADGKITAISTGKLKMHKEEV
jgi:hypothetical protein